MIRYVFLLLSIGTQLFFSYCNERKYEGLEKYKEADVNIQRRLEIIDSYLPSCPVVFEAGAYDGNDSIKMAKMWPESRIISFEPNPAAFELYKEKAQNYKNMIGYNLALNTYNGTATFYLCWGSGGKDPIFEGASSLLLPSKEMEIHYMGPTIEVPCVVFDDWCRENHIEKIDFMWLDLEGFELQFFKSSPKILETVKVIYTETNLFPFRQGTTIYSSLSKFLKSQGFVPVAHWYNKDLQGDAIFVRQDLLAF